MADKQRNKAQRQMGRGYIYPKCISVGENCRGGHDAVKTAPVLSPHSKPQLDRLKALEEMGVDQASSVSSCGLTGMKSCNQRSILSDKL